MPRAEFAMVPDGFVVRVSHFDPTETVDRLVAAITHRGMTIMGRIDHAEAAKNIGMELRPTQVLIFGNPRGGTPLMQAVQTIGIDLPLKILVWQDADGRTWIGYNDPRWIAARHGLEPTSPAIAAMIAALDAIANEVGA